MSGFPRVIVTLSPRVFPHSDREIVINPRLLSIWRGGELAQFSTKGRARDKFSSRFRIAAALIAAHGHLVSFADLETICWADQEDGGPLTGHHVIFQTVFHIKPKLALLQLAVSNHYGQGFRAHDGTAGMQRSAA